MNSTNQSQIPVEIKGYLESLLDEANINGLDGQMGEGMVLELYSRLDSYLTSVIVNSLQPEDIEAFIKINEEKKPQQEVEQFLKDKIPNVQEVFSKAFVDFKDLYLGKKLENSSP